MFNEDYEENIDNNTNKINQVKTEDKNDEIEDI